MTWFRRKHRLAETKAALEKQQRLGEYIDMQQQEAREIGDWARERLARNHLTLLFEAITSEGSR